MRKEHAKITEEVLALRRRAVEALNEASNQSGMPLRAVIREMLTVSADSVDSTGASAKLALSVMRHKNTIDYLIRRVTKGQDFGQSVTNALRLAVYEGLWLNVSTAHIMRCYSEWLDPWTDVVKEVLARNLDDLPRRMPLVNRLSLTLSYPTFLVQTLLDNMKRDDAVALMRALNGPRRYYLRPNRLQGGAENGGTPLSLSKAAQLHLEKYSDPPVVLEQDPEVTHIWEVKDGIHHVIGSKGFRAGDVIVQDKASVLAVDSLCADVGDKVWDACAAPGMKTQLLAELVGPDGIVIASDVYGSRIRMARRETARLRATQVQWVWADASSPAISEADKILIDAPCTSTGVLQTYPSFKWRLNKRTLFGLMTVQNKILDGILTGFSGRPGTEVVYSTCSILPHEGESQIDSVLSRHDVELLEPAVQGSTGYPGFACSRRVRRLFPHIHGCNGFFIARFRVKH